MVPKHPQDVGSSRWIIVRNLMVIPQIVLSLQYIFWFFNYSQTSRQQTTINTDPLIKKVEATLQNVMAGQPPPLTYPPQKWRGVGWPAMKMNFPSDRCAGQLCDAAVAASVQRRGSRRSAPSRRSRHSLISSGWDDIVAQSLKVGFFDRKWWLKTSWLGLGVLYKLY